jgi:hypothetical protein
MAVYLRKRKNSDGSTSLFLAIPEKNANGKWIYKYEFLSGCKLKKASNTNDRLKNRERLALAEEIKNKRALDLQSGHYGIQPKYRQNIDF